MSGNPWKGASETAQTGQINQWARSDLQSLSYACDMQSFLSRLHEDFWRYQWRRSDSTFQEYLDGKTAFAMSQSCAYVIDESNAIFPEAHSVGIHTAMPVTIAKMSLKSDTFNNVS